MIVLSRCQPSMSRKMAMIIASAGTIWTMRIAMMNPARLRKRKRVTAMAARNAKTSDTATVSSVTASELPSAGRNGARVSPVMTDV